MEKVVDRVVPVDFSPLKRELAETLFEAFTYEAQAHGWMSHEIDLVLCEAVRKETDAHAWKVICLHSETPQ